MSLLLLALDQWRRSKEALRFYARSYQNYPQSTVARQAIPQLVSDIKAQLSAYDPAKLKATFGANCADLAIAGGGAKSLYALGAYFALQHAGVTIDRASGTSSGAYISALLLGTQYRVDDLLQEQLIGWGPCVVQAIHDKKTLCLGKIWKHMSILLKQRLAGWVPKTDTLFINVTTLGRSGLVENVVSEFASPEDLEETICASMSIPFILCDGPFTTWRGQRGLDGGFSNNCPISCFLSSRRRNRSKGDSADGDFAALGSLEEDRIIVKVDANALTSMPCWRKALHVAYAPMEFCCDIVLEGMRDMLEVMSTGKQQLNGIKVIPYRSPMQKRDDFSYQLLPGREHFERLRKGKSILWNVDRRTG
ncbi:unnamed protein product [Prorocentrum cordatum]|uniref:PNPLA domain-containing protein n=1 Tax=Prorocentrum cordatum TaxID=2364126 RepID=A0ABN9VIV8_9DINO|nr:unnamed protein product [Polarella glacialis]